MTFVTQGQAVRAAIDRMPGAGARWGSFGWRRFDSPSRSETRADESSGGKVGGHWESALCPSLRGVPRGLARTARTVLVTAVIAPTTVQITVIPSVMLLSVLESGRAGNDRTPNHRCRSASDAPDTGERVSGSARVGSTLFLRWNEGRTVDRPHAGMTKQIPPGSTTEPPTAQRHNTRRGTPYRRTPLGNL